MQRRTLAATALGTLAGAALGLFSFAVAAGRTLDSGVAPGGGPADATVFVVSRGAMTLLVVVAGAALGGLVSALAYAVGRLADPRQRRYPPTVLLAVGVVTGAAVAFAASRAGIGAAADSIVDGVVTVTVFRAAIVAAVSGAVTGAVVAGGVERLSRPSLYGFGGEAWPSSPAAFLRAATVAVGIPMIGMVVAFAAVFGLSRVLLAADHLVALFIFSGAAAVILFGAAAIAAREPRRRP